jgi:hypothetical protein
LSKNIAKTDSRGIKGSRAQERALEGSLPASVGKNLDIQTDKFDSDDDFIHRPLAQDFPTLSDDLADALGPEWTRSNPVWGVAALDRIRALQCVLISAAVDRPEDDRAVVLDAVKCLEISIGLRLRFEEGKNFQNIVTNKGVMAPKSA